MKLKNKKTGKITEIEEVNLVVMNDDCNCYESFAEYHSLAELNADWEDYEPKEPLIEDEKIRKAVKAWAEANDISQQIQFDGFSSGFSASDAGHNILSMISFDGYVFNCVDGEYYTIDELCGEEEE